MENLDKDTGKFIFKNIPPINLNYLKIIRQEYGWHYKKKRIREFETYKNNFKKLKVTYFNGKTQVLNHNLIKWKAIIL